jgi:hypothetical protein
MSKPANNAVIRTHATDLGRESYKRDKLTDKSTPKTSERKDVISISADNPF